MSAKEHASEQEVAAPEAPPPAAARAPEAGAADPSAGGAADGAEAPLDELAGEPAPATEEEPAAEAAPEELDESALRERAGRADQYLDLAQRTQADFDNYRKRMTREVRAAEARGIGKLARELLPALDNLERALAAVESSDPDHHLSAGIRLVSAELSAALGRTGVEGYSPAGEPFDPAYHEAVAQQPVEGAEPGTVVEVLQSGYRLNDSILRPARVIVAS